MRSFKTCSMLLLTVAALAPATIAAEKPAAHAPAKNSAFDKFKALAGDWEVEHTSSEHGMPGGSISYKVTAGGAAVVETTFQGTPHEMVTVYYVDTDGGMCLTHYCVLGNRPHMRACRRRARTPWSSSASTRTTPRSREKTTCTRPHTRSSIPIT